MTSIARALMIPLCAATLAAQTTVAPTGEPTSSARGQNIGEYNVLNSFEAGYRFRLVDGSLDKYRSDVNFGNGIRLLASSLSVQSRDGRGGLFDELLLNTQGLGGDPYQFASFRLQKNRLYRYDLIWREDDYFNPALPIAYGLHRMDTARRLQDHSMTLLPQSRFRILVGYTRNTQSGPALTTINLLGPGGAEFPLFSDVRRTQDEYRAGVEATVGGVKFAVTRAWEFFRDDTRDTQSDAAAISGLGTLDSLRRDQPMHGTVGHWRAYIVADRWKHAGLNGRFTYAGGRQNFLFDESAAANLVPGGSFIRQTLIEGTARRPLTAANLTASLLPSPKLTIVNHTSFNQTRIDGDSVYNEVVGAGGGFSTVNFQFLGIRLLTNTTTLDFRPVESAGFYGGYHFAERRIQSVVEPGGTLSEQHNILHSGFAGVRLTPWRPLSVRLEAEIGRADRPIYPISDKDYHGFSARVQYRAKRLQLSTSARSSYNFNSVSLSTHSSRSRNYSADASWSPRDWFGFDASYSKLHLDSLSGIAYFAAGSLIGDRSWYESNIHSGTLGAHFQMRSRATLFVGYSRIQDTGSDLRIPTQTPVLFTAQVFPLAYSSPSARLSVRLTGRLRWNAGYQFYRYAEELQENQNYRAHTGFTSFSWSF